MVNFHEAFPIVYVDDVSKAIAFYGALGFEVGFRWEDRGETTFAFLRLEPLGIGLASRARATHNPGRGFELCIYADDADAAAALLREAGAMEEMPPQDEPWGERRAYFRDPDGTLIHVAAKLG